MQVRFWFILRRQSGAFNESFNARKQVRNAKIGLSVSPPLLANNNITLKTEVRDYNCH
jgi:hypothetical protein